VLLADLVACSDAVAATSARSQKTALLADALRRLAPEEVPAGVAFLSGELLQRQIGVGWAALRDAPAPAASPSLTVAEVAAAFADIGALRGPGSQSARREALRALLARATAPEADWLVRLLLGDLRQGALAGVMAATVMVTVPINRKLEAEAPRDYAREEALAQSRNWSRAHAVRTTLGVGAFLCAVASNLAHRAAK